MKISTRHAINTLRTFSAISGVAIITIGTILAHQDGELLGIALVLVGAVMVVPKLGVPIYYIIYTAILTMLVRLMSWILNGYWNEAGFFEYLADTFMFSIGVFVFGLCFLFVMEILRERSWNDFTKHFCFKSKLDLSQDTDSYGSEFGAIQLGENTYISCVIITSPGLVFERRYKEDQFLPWSNVNTIILHSADIPPAAVLSVCNSDGDRNSIRIPWTKELDHLISKDVHIS